MRGEYQNIFRGSHFNISCSFLKFKSCVHFEKFENEKNTPHIKLQRYFFAKNGLIGMDSILLNQDSIWIDIYLN
jgi:hypothetical protein